jgi:uncharacterized protein (DUF1501 family)
MIGIPVLVWLILAVLVLGLVALVLIGPSEPRVAAPVASWASREGHLDEAEALLARAGSRAVRYRPRTAAALAARAQAHAAFAESSARVALAARSYDDWPDFERRINGSRM